jgi:hypothetical protein
MLKSTKAAVLLLVLTCGASLRVMAQSEDENSVSLGDLARYLRQNKPSDQGLVIDNDNFSQVMKQAEQQRSAGILSFSINSAGNAFQVSSPDVTCNLSFNANATSLLTDPLMPRKLPEAELAKLDGPARIDGDDLEIALHNGSDWTVREITVGLTIVRPESYALQDSPLARFLPAADSSISTNDAESERRSDQTMILHLKASGEPMATTVFSQALNGKLTEGEEWHWAIIDAKGSPPAVAAGASSAAVPPSEAAPVPQAATTQTAPPATTQALVPVPAQP